MDSTHFSRYFNHRFPDFNLNFTVNKETRTVNFYARRDIAEGEELTFDYGMSYWQGSGVVPLGDTRNYTQPARPRPESLGPPPITPRTAADLDAAMAQPEAECRAALLRCLEYFGATRLPCDEGAPACMRVPFGLGPDAPTQDVNVADAPIETLRGAAEACVRQAAEAEAASTKQHPGQQEDEEPNTEEASHGDGSLSEPEVQLWRRFISKCPPFATAELNACALAVLLLWSFPTNHGVTQELTTQEWEQLLARVRECERNEDAEAILMSLEAHAPRERIDALMAAARLLV